MDLDLWIWIWIWTWIYYGSTMDLIWIYGSTMDLLRIRTAPYRSVPLATTLDRNTPPCTVTVRSEAPVNRFRRFQTRTLGHTLAREAEEQGRRQRGQPQSFTAEPRAMGWSKWHSNIPFVLQPLDPHQIVGLRCANLSQHSSIADHHTHLNLCTHHPSPAST